MLLITLEATLFWFVTNEASVCAQIHSHGQARFSIQTDDEAKDAILTANSDDTNILWGAPSVLDNIRVIEGGEVDGIVGCGGDGRDRDVIEDNMIGHYQRYRTDGPDGHNMRQY